MANFFGWIEVGYTFTDTTTFQDVLENVKKQFETELVKEKIAMLAVELAYRIAAEQS